MAKIDPCQMDTDRNDTCKWISASWTLRTDVLVGNKLGGLAPRSAIAPAFAGLDGQGKSGRDPH